MGMGDRKKPFTPSYESVRCDVTGKRFPKFSVRECPDPAMIKRYGVGGVCNVAVWVCYNCKYVKQFNHTGAVGCGLDKRFQAGKKS